MHSQSLQRAWQFVAFSFAAIAAVFLVLGLANAARVVVPGAQGFLGYEAKAAHFNGAAAHRVTGFEPESSLPSAGVVTGDLIIDPPRGTLLADESVRLQIAHEGSLRSVLVSAVRIGRLATPVQNGLDFGLASLLLVLGSTIALRRPRDIAALALASVFFLGVAGIAPDALPSGRIAALVHLWRSFCLVLALPIGAYFSLVFDGTYASRKRVWLLRAIVALGVAGAASALLMAPYYLGRVWVAPDSFLSEARTTLMVLGVVLCSVAFTDAWHHADAERRGRLRWLFVGFGLFLVNFCLFIAAAFGFTSTVTVELGVASDLVVATGLVMVTYAILRHRVIDVGLAVNRALVFAAFTSLLLVSFALAEWMVDHFVRFGNRQRSVLLDGGIAVALYLVFHRARNWIERMVERVFFRSWHLRQVALQRFWEMAPHFSSAEALTEALVAAADAYAGSRGSGVYRRDETGRFILERATLHQLPREVDADAAVIVEMKAFKEALHLSDRVALAPAVLALQMFRRSELVGFLAVGEKTDREVFRLDEIEYLARTAREVGFDLYALRLEQLERRGRELEQQNEGLRAGLQSLQSFRNAGAGTPSMSVDREGGVGSRGSG